MLFSDKANFRTREFFGIEGTYNNDKYKKT